MLNFGEALKYQREVSGLNQPELAKKIGTSQQNISRWERGEVLPNIDFCVRLANFYGITLDELVGRDSIKRVTVSDSFNNNSGNINFKA